MKIVITGATGWLGQSATRAIKNLGLISSTHELMLFGSNSRVHEDFTYGDVHIKDLGNWSNDVDSASLFIHFAFKTRDYVEKMASTSYLNENRTILENSIALLKKMKPKSVILVSSGVVSRYEMTSGRSDVGLYTEMKILEEGLFTAACAEIGAALFVLRLWGATGESMTEPRKYAIGDLISQALYSEQIKVTSANKVYRRYTDATQLMEVSILAALDGRGEVVDSGGEIIEMGALASRVGDLLAPRKSIVRDELKGLIPDIYLSASVRMEELAGQYSVQFFGIDEQIRQTTLAVIRDSK